ncbi:G patch domain-containing protein 8 [Beauveria bassiana]|nr:G patch domain-containing protein 8 [Beauveria bassiana]KAH8711515.1 G patch domain-containing protein 8 [Beauveria bassiana]
MPPRHQTLPPAATSSARDAQKSFYCALCAKGYTRMNDYEAHLGSYDHSHKQRLKDMKAMVRDPAAGARARKAEAKADGLISIKVPDGGGATASTAGGGFKKGGFKKSGFKSTMAPVTEGQGKPETVAQPVRPEAVVTTATIKAPLGTGESDTEDEGYEVYDPRYPTD